MIHVTTVERLPKDKQAKHTTKEMDRILYGFMKLDQQFGKVECWRSTYGSIKRAQTSLCQCIAYRKLPIAVSKIDGELYLIRKDM